MQKIRVLFFRIVCFFLSPPPFPLHASRARFPRFIGGTSWLDGKIKVRIRIGLIGKGEVPPLAVNHREAVS